MNLRFLLTPRIVEVKAVEIYLGVEVKDSEEGVIEEEHG